MKIEKEDLITQMPGLYAVTEVTLDGQTFYAAASENRGGKVFLVNPETRAVTELYGGMGGVMAILDVKDENAILFIEEFYPVFDSATAKVIKAELQSTGKEEYTVKRRIVLAEIPYVHRIAFLSETDGIYLAAGKLCKHKDNQDDWTTTGTMEIGKYDPSEEKIEMKQIYDGVTKHHAMFVSKQKKGIESLFFGGTEGVFQAQLQNGEWSVEQLLDVPTSDIVYMDLDGDGKNELAIIEEFHGNQVTVFKNRKEYLERMVEVPIEFGHVLWGGEFLGRPALLIGSRAGDKTLKKMTFLCDADDKIRIDETIILDAGQAPAQIFVTGTPEKTIVVAANHGAAKMTEYVCTT